MSISRNTAYNLMGTLAPIFAAVLTIPAYLRLIGEQRYGVLAIVWLFVGYFGIFDIGLGRAVAQRVAGLHGTHVEEARAKAFWTALSLNSGLGLIGALLLVPLASYYFSTQLQLAPDVKAEVMRSMPLMGVLVFVAVATGSMIGFLHGVEKFRALNLANGTGSVLFFVAPLVAAMLWGANILVVIMAVVACRVAVFLLLLRMCQSHVRVSGAPGFCMTEARRLFGFGGWIALSSLVSPFLVFADRLLIGSVLGPRAVTQYSVPYQLAERTSIVAAALASSLFPRYSRGTEEVRAELSVQAVKTLVVIMTPPCVVAILGAELFLKYWISPEFAATSAVLAQFLLFGFWANSLARIPHAHLQGAGRPKVVAIVQCAELVPFLGAMYYCLQRVGLEAASALIAIRLLLDFVLLSIWAGIFAKILPFVLTGAVFLLTAIAVTVFATTGTTQAAFGIATAVASLLWAAASMPPVLRHRLRSLASPVFSSRM